MPDFSNAWNAQEFCAASAADRTMCCSVGVGGATTATPPALMIRTGAGTTTIVFHEERDSIAFLDAQPRQMQRHPIDATAEAFASR